MKKVFKILFVVFLAMIYFNLSRSFLSDIAILGVVVGLTIFIVGRRMRKKRMEERK